MKRTPEIAPEMRGLLEELVADSCSSIGLAPRRPLREWFERDESLASRDPSRTALERHLLAAHREALAAMLCDAARIAFWKRPVFAHRPEDRDGLPFDEQRAERDWRPSAERRFASRERGEGVELLRRCLEEIRPEDAHALALFSLSVVPSDRARFVVALTVPWDRPAFAAGLFERLAARSRSAEEKSDCTSSLAARLCAGGRYREALDAYRTASSLMPDVPTDRFYVFHLCCLLGEAADAEREARTFDALLRPQYRGLDEARGILREWHAKKSPEELGVARAVATRLRGNIPESAASLFEAMSP